MSVNKNMSLNQQKKTCKNSQTRKKKLIHQINLFGTQ